MTIGGKNFRGATNFPRHRTFFNSPTFHCQQHLKSLTAPGFSEKSDHPVSDVTSDSSTLNELCYRDSVRKRMYDAGRAPSDVCQLVTIVQQQQQ